MRNCMSWRRDVLGRCVPIAVLRHRRRSHIVAVQDAWIPAPFNRLSTFACNIPPGREVSTMTQQWDEFSMMLAVSVSRRESLRTIGLVIAGATLSTLGLNTAWAARPDRCTAFCRSCPNKTKRNQCLEACRACNGNTSRLCGSCGAYVCCPAGFACCNGICTDLNSDAKNCSACGNVCPADHVCQSGSCVLCSGYGAGICSGVCMNLLSDNANCGSCGHQCAPDELCTFGVCTGTCSGCQ
jgi:Stigma-specific protein, Stig1